MMRKKVQACFVPSFFFVLLLASITSSAGEKPKPDWKNLGEGVALASKTNKKALIDVYTDWCGWCKKMDADVYTDSSVIRYINETFVPIKINAESGNKHAIEGKEISEAELARAYGVRGYPTTVFTQPNGQMITAVPGYIKSGPFLQILKYIGGEHYLKMKFDEFVAKGGK